MTEQKSSIDKAIRERLASEERQASFWFGVETERERIVALLENAKSRLDNHATDDCKCGDFAEPYGWAIQDIISVIKGEEQ